MALGLAARIQLLRFLAAVLFFHGSEYILAASIHGRSSVTLSSLLISKQYAVAMICALLEYKIELVFFPELKENWWMSNIGLMMVIIGEVIRKAAVLTARRSFTHTIRVYYENHHQLITHGIYRHMPDLEKELEAVLLRSSAKYSNSDSCAIQGIVAFLSGQLELSLCSAIPYAS